jgi:integrase
MRQRARLGKAPNTLRDLTQALENPGVRLRKQRGHFGGYPRDHRRRANAHPRPDRPPASAFHNGRRIAGPANASLLARLTGNLGIVQKRLGHSSIAMTWDRYHQYLPAADKSLADALGAMFDATDAEPTNVIELTQHEQA